MSLKKNYILFPLKTRNFFNLSYIDISLLLVFFSSHTSLLLFFLSIPFQNTFYMFLFYPHTPCLCLLSPLLLCYQHSPVPLFFYPGLLSVTYFFFSPHPIAGLFLLLLSTPHCVTLTSASASLCQVTHISALSYWATLLSSLAYQTQPHPHPTLSDFSHLCFSISPSTWSLLPFASTQCGWVIDKMERKKNSC